MSEPTTQRGRDTKRRIIAAAAELMYQRGVSATSVEDVLDASETGKGQFYHYFSSKEDLVAEILDYQLNQILEEQNSFPSDSWAGIRSWFDALVSRHEAERGFHGCPLGSIASQVLGQSDPLRLLAAEAFTRWESSMTQWLSVIQAGGLLRQDADPAVLAQATIAIVQGGYLLSATKRDAAPMRNALAAGFSHLTSFAAT
ncbi:TetR/AcrR family transcriptional regulator [Geodermatophilus sp. TF02-6]|uniref:TetR/AcrR family transcriptional regulator n=1 Tax=Geodermatophilus sp. TF02-6 TaxID=2250575 RepID=UPI000DEB26BF|nr:TetR/AcrR family transcriptional regulator [Geodermatophilus sp. TF02-6]RBY82540.1 TetR/AcrR family transcriptional regulator [Geodermatophilus sp. TF02-6]